MSLSKYCTVVLWKCPTIVPWFGVIDQQLYCGTVAFSYYISVVQFQCPTVVLYYYGNAIFVLWFWALS